MPRYTHRQSTVRTILSIYIQWKRAQLLRKQARYRSLAALRNQMFGIHLRDRQTSISSSGTGQSAVESTNSLMNSMSLSSSDSIDISSLFLDTSIDDDFSTSGVYSSGTTSTDSRWGSISARSQSLDLEINNIHDNSDYDSETSGRLHVWPLCYQCLHLIIPWAAI